MAKSSFENYFSFQIFFIFLRESLEIIIIISILLTIVKQALFYYDNTCESSSSSIVNNAEPVTVEEEAASALLMRENEINSSELGIEVDNEQIYKRLKFQIISGGLLGLLACMLIGGAFIVAFYYIGADLWSLSEHYYEGVLSVIASVIISVMGLFFLRMGKLREKFRVKLASIIYSDKLLSREYGESRAKTFGEKYSLFILPFVTSLREGLEAVVFIGGIGIDSPLTSIPLSMLSATAISAIFGVFFFKYSKSFSLQICLVITTCFLYLIAGGLFSKGVWQFELQRYVDACNGQDMSEVGNGPGSYDISRSVWHVNCCNGERDGFWMVLTAIFGWTNSATYGSVISYIAYWLVVIAVINLMMVEEKYGYIPFLPISLQRGRINKRITIIEKSLSLKSQPASAAVTSSSIQKNTPELPRSSCDTHDSSSHLLSADVTPPSYQ